MFTKDVKPQFRLSLGEGNTPCTNCDKLAKHMGVKYVYLKREDLNPTGSFKDRSIAFQISAYLQSGKKDFVISSSGNAAISAIGYCRKANCNLHVYISDKIPDEKLIRVFETAYIDEIDFTGIRSGEIKQITKLDLTLNFTSRAKSDALKFSRKKGFVYLRGSTDDLAPVGYKTISYELVKQVKQIDAIFIPCSSGASTLGIYSGFYDVDKPCPRLHIVQTTKIHPIASIYDQQYKKSETSLSSAISDRVALRKDQVSNIVTKSGGTGWVVNDDEIDEARRILNESCGIKTSYDSALSLAGFKKALLHNHNIKIPLLILSGK
ncbi:MAG: pyridoxal-phosphate dependent enzyme [Patescibacteria group bacterium]|nr:pyridoxal-phosphate dependent enzyme [Patescibacteria group bacterium]